MPNTRASSCYIFESGEAALGCDFGSTSSKQALAYIEASPNRVMMTRVPLDVGIDDPDRTDSLFELAGIAALDNGSFVVGKRSLTIGDTIPLKTLLTYASGISNKEIIKRLPGGANLIKALQTGQVTDHSIDSALSEHFSILHRSATKQASSRQVTIKVVIMTYPNYLCARESDKHFDMYIKKYRSILHSIWGDTVVYQTASEGQSAAAYICELFDDPVSTSREQRHAELFHGLDRKNDLNLLVVDVGASTMNFQALSVYFDENGHMSNSMSNVPHGLATGTQGGSDVSNHIIAGIIEREFLRPLTDELMVPKGDTLDFIVDFERKKKRFDYASNEDHLLLQGGNPIYTIPLTAQQVRSAFERAFQDGIKLLKKQLRRMLNLGYSFAVLFCGGSYCNPGLHNVVAHLMKETQAAGQRTGVNVQYMFLRDEVYSSSAVSVGAAVGMMRLPIPIDVLKGSAIGLQEITRLKSGRGTWRGSEIADILYSAEQRPPQFLDVDVPKDAKRWLEFFLVCDPNWTPAQRRITIGSPKMVLGGPISTYDLGFTIRPADIPHGRVRLTLEDLHEDQNRWDRPICLVLRCFKVSVTGRRMSDPKNAKWNLELHTDPQSKFLHVKYDNIVKFQPYICDFCNDAVEGAAMRCRECPSFTLCRSCYPSVSQLHSHTLYRHSEWRRTDESITIL